MEMLKKVNAIVLGLAILLAVGCGKEKDVPTPGMANLAGLPCRMLQDSSTDGTVVNNYFYNEEGKLLRINRNHYGQPLFETLKYDNAGKLIQSNVYYQDSTLQQYYTHHYNASGQLIRQDWFLAAAGGTSIPNGTMTFTYDANGNITERSTLATNQSVDHKYVYTHRPDGSILEKEYNAFLTSGVLQFCGITEYKFDTKQNAYPWFGTGQHIHIVTPHNVVSMKQYDTTYTRPKVEYLISYQYNAQDYPVSWVSTNVYENRVYTGTYDYNCR
jgi:YD repeat-containing protein